MTELVISTEIDGIHCWPDAPDKYKEFKNPHRHLFKIICIISVNWSGSPDRRDKELWELRADVNGLIKKIGIEKGPIIDFGSKSCEGIADNIKMLLAPEYGDDVKVFVGEEYWLGALVS
jgi:hypothetical protein